MSWSRIGDRHGSLVLPLGGHARKEARRQGSIVPRNAGIMGVWNPEEPTATAHDVVNPPSGPASVSGTVSGPPLRPYGGEVTPTTGIQGKVHCGPDITQACLDALSNYMKEIDAIGAEHERQSASAAKHGKEDLGIQARSGRKKSAAAKRFGGPGGPMDFKRNGKNQNTPDCPLDCPESVYLCGYCISDQVPGNIALGFAIEYADMDVGSAYLARTYSNTMAMTEWAKYQAKKMNGDAGNEPEPGMVDSAEDTHSIVAGSAIALPIAVTVRATASGHAPESRQAFRDGQSGASASLASPARA